MPIYEYKCNICGQIFEKLLFASDHEKEISCPKCGDKKISRLLSATGILGTRCAGTQKGFS